MWIHLAPHHDDILLSVPRRILDRRGAGDLVVVVFSEEDAALESACAKLHRELGLAVETMGLLEAGRRGVSTRDLLRTAPRKLDAADEALVEEIEGGLRALLARFAPERLLSPLLGIHVDHELTRRAAARCAPPGTLLHYEDVPYGCTWPRSLATAKAGLERHDAAPPVARADAAGKLLGHLDGLIPERHLRRALELLDPEGSPEAEPLWRSRDDSNAGE